MDLEDGAFASINARIDAQLADFNRYILRKNPAGLNKSAAEFFEEWKPEPDMDLIEDVYRLFFRSWLLGMSHCRRGVSPDYDDVSVNLDFGLTFEEAIEFLGGHVTMTRAQFNRLSDDMKLHAFTVGRLTQLDMIEKVRGAYAKQLSASGSSLDEFLKDVYEIDASQANFGSYYSTVFRTNIQKDYNAGRAYQMMQDPPLFLEFIGVDDDRQSEICQARTGIVLPYTDPWWDSNWPPLHYNCRSTVREIFEDEAVERHLIEPRNDRGREYYEIRNSRLEEQADKKNMVSPSGGFGHNPAKDNAFWGTTISQQNRVAQYMIQDELNGVAGQTICKDFAEDKAGFTRVETKSGGVRYDNRISSDELDKNVGVARALAEGEGYYVELRSNPALEANPQCDAWLNGVEKAEIKNITTSDRRSIRSDISKAKAQASTIILNLAYGKQVQRVGEILKEEGPDLAYKFGVKQVKIIHKDKICTLTRDDLTTAVGISNKLAWLGE